MGASRFRRFAVSFALVVGSIGFAIVAVLVADRLIGRWVDDPRFTAGLLFPPQVELAVKTYEHSYTIRTNALGLRDEEYDPDRRPRVVVAAIGDSFTFGQGVDLSDTWVQRVERALRDKGLDVEILNMGQPGSSPPHYAQLAEETLSAVQPDLVLVCVLQSNDFEFLDPNENYEAGTRRRDPPLRSTLRTWFPNLTDLAYRERVQQLAARENLSNGRWSLIQNRWKEDFKKYYDNFDSVDEGARFSFLSLPTPIQDALRNGELPPLMAYMCAESLRAKHQDWWALTVDSPEMQTRIAIVANSFQRIQRAESAWGKTVVLALPSMDNTDPFSQKLWYRLFGLLERPSLDDTRADEAIREAAARASLPSHDVTAAFREAARREPLFYPLDSHLNPRGNEVFAELITPVIEQYVREIAER